MEGDGDKEGGGRVWRFALTGRQNRVLSYLVQWKRLKMCIVELIIRRRWISRRSIEGRLPVIREGSSLRVNFLFDCEVSEDLKIIEPLSARNFPVRFGRQNSGNTTSAKASKARRLCSASHPCRGGDGVTKEQ